MKAKFYLIIFFLAIFYDLSAEVLIRKDLAYLDSKNVRNLLDVYYPENINEPKDVLVFIHGGSWNSGNKEMYWWLGKNMARKNTVSVIINYSLSPEFQYEKMASDCAMAIKWVRDSISRFAGRSDRIFVMGHSAGGHLAALINNDPRFFEGAGIPNPIRGIILNDSFGLDMFEYLNVAKQNKQTAAFFDTFTKDQEKWKVASPMYYLKNVYNPFLVLVGDRTYSAIKLQSQRLLDELLKDNKSVEMKTFKGKKHKAMVIQMVFKNNQIYDYILEFMAKV
jgi:acetyl esterase/lipase